MLNEIGGDNTRIVVSSFRFSVMKELKRSKLGYNLAFLYHFFTPIMRRIANLDFISAFNPKHIYLKDKHVRFYHQKQKKVYPWTIDEKEDLKKLVDKNVDGIITNDPEKTRKIVESILQIKLLEQLQAFY